VLRISQLSAADSTTGEDLIVGEKAATQCLPDRFKDNILGLARHSLLILL
jgi:hypothetical protein